MVLKSSVLLRTRRSRVRASRVKGLPEPGPACPSLPVSFIASLALRSVGRAHLASPMGTGVCPRPPGGEGFEGYTSLRKPWHWLCGHLGFYCVPGFVDCQDTGPPHWVVLDPWAGPGTSASTLVSAGGHSLGKGLPVALSSCFEATVSRRPLRNCAC